MQQWNLDIQQELWPNFLVEIAYAGKRIREYLKTHPGWIEGDRQSLVRDLVQLEIDAGTPFVGGPVDLMQIDAEGSHWVQRKPACVNGHGS